MNKLEFESNEVKAYVQQLQAENGLLRQANDEKNELLIKLGCPTKATAKRKVFTLEEQLKRKEQECEELRFPMPDTNYAILTKEEFEQLDQLKIENEELTSKCSQLKQTLAEIKPVLEIYSNSKIGEILDDGRSMAYLWSRGRFGFPIPDCSNVYIYDPNPAREALRKINECEGDNEV